MGDGGHGGDPDGNAQDLGTLLGSILRIDPRPSGGRPYTVPPDNPFAGRPGARGEIWAYGLRNPWRFSFDAATGALWIGDVGQADREEVNMAPPGSRGGENYGWDLFEGTLPFEGDDPAGLVPPVYDYGREDGNCAVTGGYVYRGERLPALRGRYVFADFCRGEVLALVDGDGGMQARALGPRLESVASFGEDAARELYVLSLAGALFRLDPA
ncbi:MAG: PQQ-dependent sugar dehydrogenase [Acidimicrobiia bacterium]